VWVDGVHLNIRLEDDLLCTLMMIGARPNGEKELLAVEDGYRESAESWKALLRDLKQRGMAAPALAVGDGALGSGPRCARCGPRPASRPAGVTNSAMGSTSCPNGLQPRAKRALHEMMYAECRVDGAAARSRFEAEYQPKYPKAVESLTANRGNVWLLSSTSPPSIGSICAPPT
jgi:putative transposase